jgi:hypothetical protein
MQDFAGNLNAEKYSQVFINIDAANGVSSAGFGCELIARMSA